MKHTLALSVAVAALSATHHVATFEGDPPKPGWKLDEAGKIAVDGDGNPIYVNTKGDEQSVRGDKIATLNAEAKSHRERADTAETALKTFEGIDPTAARAALATVEKLDQKKLIDAGEVDRVRDEIKTTYETQVSDLTEKLKVSDDTVRSLRLDSVFNGSDFVKNSVAMPLDFLRPALEGRVKFDDKGEPYLTDDKGERLFSRKNAGEYADVNEGLQLVVESHPQRDVILKPVHKDGSGNKGGGEQPGGGAMKRVSRSEYDAATPARKSEIGLAVAKGEMSIVD